MYLPEHFAQANVGTMQALMRAHPFATLMTLGADGLRANHLPLYLEDHPLPYGLLAGHVPRANPVWREAAGDVLVVFNGPSAYITPSWYPTKKDTGKVVPTWNYTVVHARGRVRFMDDSAWLKDHLTALTLHQESAFSQPWALSDAPDAYIAKLIGALIGIEIVIDTLIGKWKLSQNRSLADRAGVAAGLRELGGASAGLVADESGTRQA